jgi:hypothetical protein
MTHAYVRYGGAAGAILGSLKAKLLDDFLVLMVGLGAV